MTDYNTNESVIYKIHCLDKSCDYVYFGSTTEYNKRSRAHKVNCYNVNGKAYNLKVYETIRAHGGLENWIMEIVEVFPCENKCDLHMREQWYIDSAKNKINSVRAFRTPEEKQINEKEYSKQFYLANKAEISEYKKQYGLANKDKIAEYKKQYQLANKEKIAEYQKKYRLANKDELIEYHKQYHLANKERISQEQNKIETNYDEYEQKQNIIK